MDSFSGHKIVTLQFAEDDAMKSLERFGDVLEIRPPRAKLRIDRTDVSQTLAALLAEHTIEDVVVEDPPLEEVIANVFSSNWRDEEDEQPAEASKSEPTAKLPT